MGITLIGVFIIYWFGGRLWHDCSIALHGQRTDGTVTRTTSRGVILYSYTVGGRDYSGTGRGDYDRSYPKGSTVEVRYSSVHPSFSTIDEPFLFLGQLSCGVAIFGAIFLTIYYGRKRRQAAS